MAEYLGEWRGYHWYAHDPGPLSTVRCATCGKESRMHPRWALEQSYFCADCTHALRHLYWLMRARTYTDWPGKDHQERMRTREKQPRWVQDIQEAVRRALCPPQPSALPPAPGLWDTA